jgi:hypothetical protein
VVTFFLCRRFGPVIFFFLQIQFSALKPGVEFGTQRVNRAAFVVEVSMNRHALALFPALNGADVSFYIGGNFLPRI